MPADPHYEKQLAQLNREIEQLEADAKRLEGERTAINRAAGRAARRFRYLKFVRTLRSPTAQLNLWPWIVLSAGPLVIGFLLFVIINLLTGSYPLAFFAFLLGIVAGVGLFATMMYHPADTLLPAAIAEAEAQARLDNARLEEKIGRIAETKQQLERFVEERRQLIASGQIQRAALLQRNWKAMRDDEWEDYLAEVCRTLGASVQRTGRAGDQGVDLIVEFGERRIAVQAKGYHHSVNSAAIQQAYAGMTHYRCTHCAAITNSRFTSGAKALALSTGCNLIDEFSFPDFVMGKIEL